MQRYGFILIYANKYQINAKKNANIYQIVTCTLNSANIYQENAAPRDKGGVYDASYQLASFVTMM